MIKKTIITSLLIASSAIAFANSSVSSNTSSANSSDRVMAGYLDITAMGSADSVDLSQVAKDGYNEAVIAFATVDANNNISFKDDCEALAAKKIQQAKDAGLKVIVSVGGQSNVNTYNPNGTDANRLAQNIVNFLNKYGLDGIDFDIEIAETATNNGIYLKNVITNIKDIDSSKLVVIAPQINNDKLVSTGNDEFYAPLFNATNKVLDLVDYVYVQNYNSVPEQKPDFVQKAYTLTKNYIGAKTAKIVIGYPTAAQGGGAATVYFPQFDDNYGNVPPNSSALQTYDAMKSVYDNLGNIPKDTKFAGFMGWSLNVDYAPEAYNTGSVKYPAHGVGDFGYYMSPCALDSNKCAKIPDEKETPKTATILVHNNSPKYGFDGGITFTSSNGSINTPGYVSPTGAAASATSPIGTSITVAPKITWYAKPLSCPNKMDTTKYSRAEIYVADNPSAPGTLAINCDFGN
ncbi:glycoside hydrolase family 18 protein [Francisella philomiragia]|uniref:glycoside hydrolase family 18 protein n=1 Tax=Francisella philomiragia TaxID=28110 RepID=UPI001C9E008C|nr:glycoside hydrolase family 18 protein [Francisella philomiragia]MBY7734690.1 glycoside hydrolase family 18 protein [Francisella philomiragia]